VNVALCLVAFETSKICCSGKVGGGRLGGSGGTARRLVELYCDVRS